MQQEEVAAFLQKFERCRILVVGDLMLDEYIWGHVQRISPEAPVPVLRLVRKQYALGGAGNVVKNLCTLGTHVCLFGVIGTDGTGRRIIEELDRWDVDRKGVIEVASRASTRKTRLMSLEHSTQVFRFDQESSNPIEQGTQERLLAGFAREIKDAHAVLCSDYSKGVLTSNLLQGVITIAQGHNLPVVVSPKDSNPSKYKKATVLIPNTRELQEMSCVIIEGDDSLTEAALNLMRGLETSSLLVTRGAHGMSLFETNLESIRRTDIQAIARTVYDVTGAGDTVASVFTLAIAAGADHETAARLANFAAGIVVEKLGAASVTRAEISARIREYIMTDSSFWPALERKL